MFLAFAYRTYYPNGGVNDLVATADSMDEALADLIAELNENPRLDNAHIYDTVTDTTTAFEEREVGTGAWHSIADEQADDRFPKRVENSNAWLGNPPDTEYRYGWVVIPELQPNWA